MNFRSFNCVVFKFKCFKEFVNRRIILHVIPIGYYAIDSTQYLPQEKEPYILPQHCSQIFCCPNVLDEKMWFVIDCDPRGKYGVHNFDENDNDD